MPQRLYFLDSLRGLAALAVVIYHLPLLADPALPIPLWASWITGAAGVTLFFAISGFSLSLTMNLHARTVRPLLSFYVKRLLRIAPLFYLVLICVLIRSHQHGAAFPPVWKLALNVTFLFNLVPSAVDSLVFAGWTIGVEMLFYAAFPLLHRCLPGPRRKTAALLVSVAAYPVFLVMLDQTSIPPELRARYDVLTIVLHLPAFLCGMLAFDLYQAQRNRAWARGGGVALIVLAMGLYALLEAGWLDRVLVPLQWQAICLGLLLFGVSLTGMPVLLGTATRLLGTISYSIYLLHGLVILAAKPVFLHIYRLDLPLPVRFLLAIAMALLLIVPLSCLSYNLVERPGMAVGKVLVAWFTRRGAVTSQASLEGRGSVALAGKQ